MIRLPTLFWLIVISTTGFAMFAVKYEVQALADQLAHTVKQANDAERAIRVLDAEWAYLNRPDALAQMNQRFLSLTPIATKQLRTNVADIPMRPAPPPLPPLPAVETVAANLPDTLPTVPPSERPAPPTAPASPVSAGPSAAPKAPDILPPKNSDQAAEVPLDTPSAPSATKPVTIARAAVRSAPPRKPASLNELIAQIADSR